MCRNKIGFIHPCRQRWCSLHSCYCGNRAEEDWGEVMVLCLSEDSGGAVAISHPWASVEGADRMIKRMAKFMKKVYEQRSMRIKQSMWLLIVSSWMSLSQLIAMLQYLKAGTGNICELPIAAEGNCPLLRMGCVWFSLKKLFLENLFPERPKFRYLRYVEFLENETLIFSSMDIL